MKTNSIPDQLVYSTVRIIAWDDQRKSIGTGFFVVDQRAEAKRHVPFLFTNCHVVKNYQKAEFTFCQADADNKPIDDRHVKITVANLQERCIRHPDPNIDVCSIILTDMMKEATEKGMPLFYKCIGTEFFITTEVINRATAIEDVIMVGYPEGLIDEKNNKPVTRKGITATSITLDYQGRKEFMIDIACFHGSSGSPVFIDQSGLTVRKNDEGSAPGFNHTYSFAGIVRAVPDVSVKGEIKIVDIPTEKTLISEAELMTNLGIVVKAERILEILDHIDNNWPVGEEKKEILKGR